MQSLLKSLNILEKVSQHQPISVGELARMMELPKSTVQRILWTFHEAGWLRLSEGDVPRWSVSSHLLTIRPAELANGGLASASRGPMTELRDATNETVYVSVADGLNGIVVIDRLESGHAVRAVSSVGEVSPLYSTANGLAMMAWMSEEQIDAVINSGLKAWNSATLVDPIELRAELQAIRERGYSINRGYYRPGIFAIGAPIFEQGNQPVGSICISMPDSRYDSSSEKAWGEMIVQAARKIGHAPPQ